MGLGLIVFFAGEILIPNLQKQYDFYKLNKKKIIFA